MKLPPKLVVIHWTDAFDSSNGWINVKEYKPTPQYVITVGYVWEDCLPGHISLTTSWCTVDENSNEANEAVDVGMVTHIPKGMVNKIVELTLPDFSSVDLTAYEETNQTEQHHSMPLSPALDYPPYEAKVQRAANHLKVHRR